MDYNKQRSSANAEIRNEEATDPARKVQNHKPGWGDKKLEGPNRPAE